MKDKIVIGSVEMPLNDFVVSRNAILGITKSGKTFTAKGIAEQLMELKIPIIVFDAIGMWRFLKVPSGKHGGKGFPIVVAGGAQPDLPLNPQTAPQIVRAAIAQNISLVIDLYDPKLSKADWRRIVQDCFRILLFENKGLRHIFLEEAAEYVPQKVMDGQTYAEVEKLARMGGNASLGITFINPRAQELNKAVLELCDNIILLRQRGTHAIDSLEKQMDKLSPDTAKEIALTMPNMTQGDCWIFTENGDEPTRTRSTQIKSFHPDRRNPEANKTAGAAVNTDEFVSALSGKLEKVIADAKANDPAELKRQLAAEKKRGNELETKLAMASQNASKTVIKTETKAIPALTDAERKRLTTLIESYERMETVCTRIENMATEIKSDAFTNRAELTFFKTLLAGKLTPLTKFSPAAKPTLRPSAPIVRRPTTAAPPSALGSGDSGDIALGKCERTLLSVLAKYPEGCTKNKLILLAGYCWSGSTQNALGKLRGLGLIQGENSGTIQITESGMASGSFEPLPEGEALVNYWLTYTNFGKCERSLLRCLIDNPKGLSREDLLAMAGYEWSGSTQNALGALRTAGVITGRNNEVMRPMDEFFQ